MSDMVENNTICVLRFLLQNIHICLELKYVKRVLPLSQLEVVPGSPSYVVGLMNLAGTSIPVIDLSLRLGIPRTKPYSIDIPILLCCNEFQQVGIIVDQIVGLAEIDETEFQMRDDFTKHDSPFLAIVPLNTQLSLLLNINPIIHISLSAEKEALPINKTLLNKAKKHHE